MPQVIEQETTYQRDFDALLRHGGAPSWLDPLRRDAMESFRALGFPTTRDEEWRFTSVKPIAATSFLPAPRATSGVTARAIAPFHIAGCGPRLVFIDGRYAPELSQTESVPGLYVSSLAEALRRDPARVQPHLARYADFRADAFAALNTAFIEDGAFIEVGRGVELSSPIHLLYAASASDKPLACHPRNLLVAQAQSRAAVLEHYVSLGPGACLSNAVTEIHAGPESHVAHYLLEEEDREAFNVSTLRVDQARGSNFESHSALYGGAIVRNNVHVELVGEGCKSLVNGLFVAAGRQHMDNHMRVVHAQPHGDSRQFYKGILGDQAHGVFTGRILVKPGAQKTDAKQTNRNLLLSDDAQIDTRPQLEIYADDVKCTHGATTGRLDENALFYLQARGIDEATAHGLLVFAFARECLERMRIAPVRERLEKQLIRRLPRSELLESLAG